VNRPNPYTASQTDPRTSEATTIASRPRFHGVGFLAVGGALAYFTIATHVITAKALLAVPLMLACGLWMVVFGYPKRKDGVAPLWWRLGLLAIAALFLAV
jgi:hypothetical protein